MLYQSRENAEFSDNKDKLAYKENGIGTSSFFATKNIKYLEEYKSY